MTTEIATADVNLESTAMTYKTLQAIINTKMIPKDYRGKTMEALACIMYGREMGLSPIEALNKIDMIDGKASPSAELMVAMVHRAGHEIFPGKTSATSVTAVAVRYRDDGTCRKHEFTFTIEMAKRAGLTGKSNWKNYPEAMLYWRAASQLARMVFSDVMTAAKFYTPDELGDGDWQPPDPEHVEEAVLVGDQRIGPEVVDPTDGPTTGSQQETGTKGQPDELWGCDCHGENPCPDVPVESTPTSLSDAPVPGGQSDIVEQNWNELIGLVSDRGWTGGTNETMEVNCRRICELMEVQGYWGVNGLRFSDVFHMELDNWSALDTDYRNDETTRGKPEHWGDLRRKTHYAHFSSWLVDEAQERLTRVLKERT